jgi:hypothetical protein
MQPDAADLKFLQTNKQRARSAHGRYTRRKKPPPNRVGDGFLCLSRFYQ